MNEKQEKVLTDLFETMKKENLAPWQMPWKVQNRPSMNAVSKERYHGINTFLTMANRMKNGFSSPYFVTFKQAKDLGGSVTHEAKGKGCTVFFYKTVNKTETDSVTMEEKNSHYFYATTYTVFNLDVTTLKDDPRFQFEETEKLSAENRIGSVEEIIKAYAKELFAFGYGGDRAFYRPSTDTVQVPEFENFLDATAFYATIFHEFSHSTGHETRLNRPLSMLLEAYSAEELVAEISSMLILSRIGIESTFSKDNSAAYIANWWKRLKDDPGMFWTAAQRAEKSADYILER